MNTVPAAAVDGAAIRVRFMLPCNGDIALMAAAGSLQWLVLERRSIRLTDHHMKFKFDLRFFLNYSGLGQPKGCQWKCAVL